MATLKEIRSRLKSIKSTQQLTKAMKMVAAAKLRKAQERTLQSRPYARKLAELLGNLSSNIDSSEFPLLSERAEIKNVMVIVVASDRGLCGAFNTNILKLAKDVVDNEFGVHTLSGNLQLITVGRKSVDFFIKRGYKVTEKYPGVFLKLNYQTAAEITGKVIDAYTSGKVDKVILIYNEFKNILSPNLKKETLLPISVNRTSEKKEYIYEPSPKEIVSKLLPKHISMQVWRSMMESSAAEEASRMAAMDSATENAKELLRTLGVSYNRARQASITKELIEIVSGANALEGK